MLVKHKKCQHVRSFARIGLRGFGMVIVGDCKRHAHTGDKSCVPSLPLSRRDGMARYRKTGNLNGRSSKWDSVGRMMNFKLSSANSGMACFTLIKAFVGF